MTRTFTIGIYGSAKIDERSLLFYKDLYANTLYTPEEIAAMPRRKLIKLINDDKWYVDFESFPLENMTLSSDQVFDIDGFDLDIDDDEEEEECE
jgi:hypothetical protein